MSSDAPLPKLGGAGAMAGQSAVKAATKESGKYNESEALVGVASDAVYSAVAAVADEASPRPASSPRS